jgi:sugar phosphate isomerase/epimerase
VRLGCVDATLWYAVEEQPDRDPFEVTLEEAARLGLVGLGGQPERHVTRQEIERLAAKARELGIAVEPKWGDRYAHPDPSGVRPLEAFVAWLDRICVPFGTPVVGLIVRGAHRFLRQPPLAEQLALAAERIRPLADVAAARGIRLALENHADYRGSEILRLIRAVDRPTFGVRLDTGNPLTIAEDPVETARVLAPYTFTTHLKDMYVYPEGRADGPRVPHMTGAPLGKGAVQLEEIIGLVRALTPDVERLPLNIEIDWRPPEEDGRSWAEESIRYCRETFGAYLTGGGRAPALAAGSAG